MKVEAVDLLNNKCSVGFIQKLCDRFETFVSGMSVS